MLAFNLLLVYRPELIVLMDAFNVVLRYKKILLDVLLETNWVEKYSFLSGTYGACFNRADAKLLFCDVNPSCLGHAKLVGYDTFCKHQRTFQIPLLW